MYRIAFVSIAALAATGCGGPSSETPVELEPGRYEIKVSGASLQGSGSAQESRCLLPDRAATFTENPLRGIVLDSTSSCTKENKREGNAFSGSLNCAAGNSETGMLAIKANYSGSLTRDSFRINGDMEVKAGDQGRSSSLSVTGKRTGGC